MAQEPKKKDPLLFFYWPSSQSGAHAHLHKADRFFLFPLCSKCCGKIVAHEI